MYSITNVLESVWALSPEDGAAAAGGVGIDVFISQKSQE